jgi:hypothetical protein
MSQKTLNKEIEEVKSELNKQGIYTDRDLLRQLNVKDEDRSKLLLWIRYQCLFAEKKAYDSLTDSFKPLKTEEVEKDIESIEPNWGSKLLNKLLNVKPK